MSPQGILAEWKFYFLCLNQHSGAFKYLSTGHSEHSNDILRKYNLSIDFWYEGFILVCCWLSLLTIKGAFDPANEVNLCYNDHIKQIILNFSGKKTLNLNIVQCTTDYPEPNHFHGLLWNYYFQRFKIKVFGLTTMIRRRSQILQMT